jgi:hypothetical protein
MPSRGQQKLEGDENLEGRPKGDQTKHLWKERLASHMLNFFFKWSKTKETIEARVRMWVSLTKEGKIQDGKMQEHKTQKWAKVKRGLKSRSP